MRPKLLASAGLIAALILGACGGGGDSPAIGEDKPVLSLMGQLSLAEMDTKAKPLESNGGNGKGRKGTTTDPAPTDPAPTEPAPTEPTPAPIVADPSVPQISMASWPNTLLQTGNDTDAYWIEDGVWGAGALTRGTYTSLTGTQYEQYTGRGTTMGPNGEVAGRMAWKWPQGTTEVKSYPSIIKGNKPGYFNTWTGPAGKPILMLNDTYSQIYPSGKTPGSFFPLQLPIASLKSSFNWKHNTTPTGRGHLAYDIWLQNTPDQINGFRAPPITHEIMIPLNYWGEYGAYPYRNPGWYQHDVTLEGYLFHVYYAPTFNGAWKFVVFEPDSANAIKPGTLNLATFINYVAKQGWASGNEYAVSVELGVEPEHGTGDLTIYNYRVWK